MNIKKLVNVFKKPALTISVLGLTIASSTANASHDFYVGAGLDYSKYSIATDVKNLYTIKKDKGMGVLVPVLGMKFSEHFGVEAGWSFNKKLELAGKTSSQGTTSNFDLKISNYYIDFMGFMPIANQFELVGGVGFGRIFAKTHDGQKVTHPACLRAKIGVQYKINNNFGVRMLASYQNINSKMTLNTTSGGIITQRTDLKFIKSMTSIGLTALYTF